MRSRLTTVLAVALLATTGLAGVHLLRAAGPLPVAGGPARLVTHRAPPGAADPDPAAGAPGVVRRLEPGERPPQFVVVSFDGVGWHEMWQHWLALGERVPFRFTGFLSGTYLLTEGSRGVYHPPHYPPGTSEIGWSSRAGLPVEIRDLDRALAAGDEIGTHFGGHFCSGAGLPSGGDTWGTADWNDELDQFFALLAHVRRNNPGTRLPALRLGRRDIRGERTPCLEGSPGALFPALRDHGLEYDSSFTRTGLAWPTRAPGGIWRLGMPLFPVHGTLPDGRRGVPVTAMDYNYFFSQRGAVDATATPATAARDREQVLATYRDMYRTALHGNRAPLILGNHFNDWDLGAYRDALTTFVLETCGRPHTACVPLADLVDWLDVQRPRVLHHLQLLPPETVPRG